MRFLWRPRVFFLIHLALLDPPMVWVWEAPLPIPRDFLPACVRPRSSLCLWTAPQIQLALGSLLMAGWAMSTMMTSKFVGGVLADPVGAEDPESLQSPANSLLRDGLEVALGLLLLDSTRGLGLSIGTSLGDGPLPAATSHGNAVDDEALLGLVPQPAGLVRPGRAGGAVDLGELAVLPAPDSQQISHHIALLLAVELGHVLVGTHPGYLLSLVEVNQAILGLHLGELTVLP